jgi:hypothetical protein
MESIRHRLAAKRDSLGKWRKRYSKVEYPKKMASNVMGSAILANTLAAEAPNFFKGADRVKDIGDALSRVSSRSNSLNNEIAKRVYDRVNGKSPTLGANSEVIQFGPLMSAASEGSEGSNQAVEKMEYNWVYNALQGDLLELWLAAGLLGMENETAFSELFYFVQVSSSLSSKDEIYGLFGQLSGVVLGAPNTYRQMPPLW